MNGIEIKIARIRAGLRQYEVAARVGMPPSRLCEIECGRRQPTHELISLIMAVIEEAQRAKSG